MNIQTCEASTGLCTDVACNNDPNPTNCPGNSATGTYLCDSSGNCAQCVTSGNVALECAANMSCDAATGACEPISCDPTAAYDASTCFANKTVCVASAADPATGSCALCDINLTTNSCATGYTYNTVTGATSVDQCVADECGNDATT